MKRRRRQTMLSTTIGIFLSLNIQVERDGQRLFLNLPLLPLTAWLWLGWQGYLRLGHWGRTGQAGLKRLFERLTLWLTLTHIGCKSILYGVGVAT